MGEGCLGGVVIGRSVRCANGHCLTAADKGS